MASTAMTRAARSTTLRSNAFLLHRFAARELGARSVDEVVAGVQNLSLSTSTSPSPAGPEATSDADLSSTSQTSTDASQSTSLTPSQPATISNPFLPTQNPTTKRWAPPKYSLRRQKELIKRAQLLGVKQGKGENTFELPLGRKGQMLSSGLVFRGVKSGGEGYSMVSNGFGAERVLKAPAGLPSITWQGEPKPVEKRAGLYEGRRLFFKGHSWERDAPLKKEMIDAKLKEMQVKLARFKNRRKGRTAGTKMPF